MAWQEQVGISIYLIYPAWLGIVYTYIPVPTSTSFQIPRYILAIVFMRYFKFYDRILILFTSLIAELHLSSFEPLFSH